MNQRPTDRTGNTRAVLRAGIEYYTAGRLEEAVRTLERAKVMRQGDVQARAYLGAAYYRQRRYHEAAEQFREAAALRGDARVLFNLGNAYLACGLPAQARDAFAAALRADPNYVAALFPLAGLERLLRSIEQGAGDSVKPPPPDG